MKIKLAKQHKDIMFWALLIAGIGFCIGGAFVPVLIPVGGILLSGAIALARDVEAEPVQNVPADLPPPEEPENPAVEHSNDEVDVSLHFDFDRHYRRSRQPPLSEDQQKEYAEHVEHLKITNSKNRPH